VLGGSDEFCGVLFNRASKSASRASNLSIFARSMRMMPCASGVCRAIIPSETSGSVDMSVMSPIFAFARRPISRFRYPGV